MKVQPLLAEFLGTFFLCFAAIASILSATPSIGSGAGITGIALANGLALSVAVNAFGGISGAHFNPAVSCAFVLTRRLPLTSLGPYIAVQLLGAFFRWTPSFRRSLGSCFLRHGRRPA